MLLTDTPAIEIEDLADHETSILDTASTEGINLTVKIGLARDEVGLQMQSRFPQLGLVNIGLMNVVITPALRTLQVRIVDFVIWRALPLGRESRSSSRTRTARR